MSRSPLLIPGVKTSVGRYADPHRALADDAFAKVRWTIVKRDQFTCQSCQFVSLPKTEAHPTSLLASGHMEAHHRDDDHHNNDKSNLTTQCPLCHAVFHVGYHGKRGAVQIIYCPWLTQEDLNLLVHCAAVAIARNGNQLADQAKALLNALRSLNSIAVEILGEAAADPTALGAALSEISRKAPKVYENRGIALQNFRVLPNPEAFKEAISYWSKHRWMPDGNWEAAWAKVFEAWQASQGKGA